MKFSYLKTSIQPGESILAIGYIHGAFLIPHAILAGLFFIGITKLLLVLGSMVMSPWIWLSLLAPVLYFGERLLFWSTAESALTTHRVIVKSGWIARSISEVAISKIESTKIDESVLGRICGFADVVITGSGGKAVSIPALANAMDFRASIQNITHSCRQR